MTEPADLDLRLVRYFTVVAEHRHFGRAAAALHVAQPSLSRQIARLEALIGARLLDRTTQGTKLTEAGEVFLPQAKSLLRSAAQAAARARAAAEPSRITVGYLPGIIVTSAVRELARQYPDADARAVYLDYREVRDALLDHRLHVTILYDERRVVIVPLDHRLAGKESVTLDDIADEPLPRMRDTDPAWSAFWRIEPRPGGGRAPEGPFIDAIEDKFEVVAAGQAIAIVADVTGRAPRPDLTSIPLEGVEPVHVVLATRADDRSRIVAAFRKIASAQLTGPEPGRPH
jgi:DNA-binding transcriptional LysR family regulator